jgi:hypothetical protein
MQDDVRRLAQDDGTVTLTVDEPDPAGCFPEGGPRGSVVMLAPYGMNAESLFAPSYVLARNGLRVFRLEPRNSPDGTTGAVLGYRLSRVTADVRRALEHTRADAVMAMSLSAPAVLRALPDAPWVRAVALVVPVVAVRSTVRQVCGVDWFERVGWDRDSRVVHVLGHDIELEFVHDCIAQGFVDRADCVADVTRAPAPVDVVAAGHDAWVDPADVRAVTVASGADLVEIPAAGHLLYRNPVVALQFFRAAAERLLRRLDPGAPPVRVPTFAEIVDALERTRRAGEPRTGEPVAPLAAVPRGGLHLVPPPSLRSATS